MALNVVMLGPPASGKGTQAVRLAQARGIPVISSLAELLQRQPGVEIVQNGGPAAVSGVFLRGANRGQTLVLVDGLRVGSSSADSTTPGAIQLDQIERIEVVRGPA